MDEEFLREAITMAESSVGHEGGPFGALVVRNGQILGRGANRVTADNDPTAHAEVVAIRDACRNAGDFALAGATLYVSCEPCPMCFAAAYWARIERIVFAASREDAAAAGFDDVMIHEQVALPPAERRLPMVQLLRVEAQQPFLMWRQFDARIDY